jgi:hypothetical protein
MVIASGPAPAGPGAVGLLGGILLTSFLREVLGERKRNPKETSALTPSVCFLSEEKHRNGFADLVDPG